MRVHGARLLPPVTAGTGSPVPPRLAGEALMEEECALVHPAGHAQPQAAADEGEA
ncbi:hypothetical protein [Streptomyces sp. NPDC006274]|uniref:hypothetical protein n=1 Tax=unclassified Streptomyces TaxID=2593676 RepID=UPI0033A91AF5